MSTSGSGNFGTAEKCSEIEQLNAGKWF